MNNKVFGIGLIVVGIIILAIVFLAVPLHLGSAGFGIKKILGLIVGLVVFVVGLGLSFAKGGGQKVS